MSKAALIIVSLTLVIALGLGGCSPATPETTLTESGTPPSTTPEKAKPDNIEWLGKVIASEAGSIYDEGNWVKCTDEERAAVGWTVLNRFKSGTYGETIEEVVTASGQYAHNQDSTPEIRELATKLLEGQIPDPTGGATHFFSPISMPKEGESTTGFDVGEELYEVPGIPKLVYFPSWTKTYAWGDELDNVRKAYFMFYRSGAPPTHQVSALTFEESGWSTPVNISHAASSSTLTSIWSEECKDITATRPLLIADSNKVLHTVWIEVEKEKIKQASESKEWYELKFNTKVSLSYSFKEKELWSDPSHIFSVSKIGSFVGLLVEKSDGIHIRWTGFGDFSLVVDKNNNLHLIWYAEESESDQTLKLETGSAPTTMTSHLLWKKLYYCQKPANGDWSEPIMLGEINYSYSSASELLGETIEGGMDNYILQVDSKGVPHILVAVYTTRWQGVYHLTKDENNIWANRGIDCPGERVNDKWRYSPFRWWATLDDRDTWHFIWDSYGGKVFYSTKPKGGSWQSPLEIYEGNALSSLTAILDTEGNLHFAWRGGPSKGPSPIIYAFKPKNGTLSDLVYLTEDSHAFSSYEWGIQLTLDGNNFPHITWVGGFFKIMYSAKLKDEGWSKPVAAISNDVGRVIVDSCLACDENALHLVVRSGEYSSRQDIFYSFKPLE